MQNSGLEWLWRIRQEPQLFRRHWTDGLFFLCTASAKRCSCIAATCRSPRSAPSLWEHQFRTDGWCADRWRTDCSRFEDFVDQILSGPEGSPLIDLAGVTGWMPAALACCIRCATGAFPTYDHNWSAVSAEGRNCCASSAQTACCQCRSLHRPCISRGAMRSAMDAASVLDAKGVRWKCPFS